MRSTIVADLLNNTHNVKAETVAGNMMIVTNEGCSQQEWLELCDVLRTLSHNDRFQESNGVVCMRLEPATVYKRSCTG